MVLLCAFARVVALCTASYFAKSCHAFASLPRLSLGTAITGPESYLKQNMVSSGFSFSDGEQILVSLQKPMGMLLEQEVQGPIVVQEVNQGGSADRAGVVSGDILVAVQNASVENADLEEALEFIGRAPRVINLRFLRKDNSAN
ncbi:hypothetical protein ACHAWF_015209 [Thalassiosira exigua]